ncbi:M16 family metallopeptidase [Patescibacteria group bacterium]
MIKIPKSFELENGLRVCIIPDENLDSVTIHLRGRVGSNYELGNEIGSAHIVEHLLLNNSQKNKIKSFGGNIVGVTSRDDVLFMVKTLKQHFPDGLDFLSEILKPKTFGKEDLKKQKSIVVQEIKRSLSMPEKAITRLSKKTIFPNQRMGKLNTGELEDVQRLNIKTIQDFHDRLYHPNNFVLVISGGVNKQVAKKYVEKFFGEFKKGETSPVLSISKENKLEIQCIEDPSLDKAFVNISYYSFPLKDESSYAAFVASKLLNNYLGNFIKSTLGLTYKVSCENFSTGSYGLFSFYFSSEEKDVGDIIKHIMKVKDNLTNVLSTRAVETIKIPIVASQIFDFEKVSIRADYYSTVLLHGTKKQNHLYDIDTIKKVNVGNVRTVSQEILNQYPKITVISKNLKNKDIRSYLE